MAIDMQSQTSTRSSNTQPRPRALDAARDPEQLYRAGRILIRQHEYRKALAVFEEALRLQPAEPRYQSYVGLCQAMVGKKLRTALDLCRQAVAADSFRAELYCNLGRVCEEVGEQRQAFQAYQRGAVLDPQHGGIREALVRVGMRRPPVLPFLPRRHPCNKYAGIVLTRLGLR